MQKRFLKIKSILFFFTVMSGILNIQAQDLEPRLLSAMPINGNITVVTYSHSGGNILVDNSLPVEDLTANINNIVFGYVRSFKLFNRLTKVDVIIPYSFGKYNALVYEEQTDVTRNGLADSQLRISMILLGVTPLKPQDYFTQKKKKFRLGVNFRVRVPVGAYDSDYALNVGTNRWTFQSGIGGSYTLKNRFIFEAHLNSWLFTKNNDFYHGNYTQQRPLFGLQLHAAYIFKPGVWLALSAGKTTGGKLEINDVLQEIAQKNSRVGAAFAYKLNKYTGLKLAYTNGFSTRTGADFNSIILGFSYVWFDKK
jgi:hypothetical protein